MTRAETLEKTIPTGGIEQISADVLGFELPVDREYGERVKADFDVLWRLYTDRRQGATTRIGSLVYEDDALVTRYYDESLGVEETYLRSRVYDPAIKSDREPSEVIFVRVASESGEEHEIFVNPAGVAAVMHRHDAESPWRNVSDVEAIGCIDELSHRALIAVERHSGRSPEEKAVADAHARALLRARMPMFAAPETSLE